MENMFEIMPNRTRIIFTGKLFSRDLKPVVQTEVMMFSHFRWQKMTNKLYV